MPDNLLYYGDNLNVLRRHVKTESPGGAIETGFGLAAEHAHVPVRLRVLAVPATTTIRGIPTEVALDRADGMPNECVAQP